MAWLLFIDESGHDHKTTPYEVRGGFAIHVGSLWPFVQEMQRLEADCFGTRLDAYGKEIALHSSTRSGSGLRIRATRFRMVKDGGFVDRSWKKVAAASNRDGKNSLPTVKPVCAWRGRLSAS